MTPSKNPTEPRRDIHITRIVKMLENKLTAKDTPVLLKEVASAVVDLSDELNEIHRAVRGYNGDAGMLTLLTRITTHLGISSDGHLPPSADKKEPDQFGKLLKWLGDKVMPQVVTIIVMAILYLAFGSGK